MKVSLVVLLLASLAGNVNGQYGCYVDGPDQWMGGVPVAVDAQCCTDQGALFGGVPKNLTASRNVTEISPMTPLANELSFCIDTIYNESFANASDHCNEDGTVCTIDYHNFTCDDEVMQTCVAEGGQVIEGDYLIVCTAYGVLYTVRYLNKVDCIARSCDDNDLLTEWVTGYAAASILSPSVDCQVGVIGDTFLVNGEERFYPWAIPNAAETDDDHTQTTAPKKTETQANAALGPDVHAPVTNKEVSRSASSKKETGLKTALSILTVALVAALAGAAFLYRRFRGHSDTAPMPPTNDRPEKDEVTEGTMA